MTIEKVKYSTENGAGVEITVDGQVVKKNVGDALLLDGLAEWIASGGVIEPFYTITAAEYNMPDTQDVISLTTVEAGRVNVSEGNVYLWSLLQEWIDNGNTVLPYQDRNREGREAAEAAVAHQQKRNDLLDEMIEKGIKVDDLVKLP